MKEERNYRKNVVFLKRFLSMLMVFAMLITSAPITSLASELEGTLSTEVVQREKEALETETVVNTEETETQATEDNQAVENTQIAEDVVETEAVIEVEEVIKGEDGVATVADDMLTVYFANPDGWSNVYGYCWNADGTDLLSAAWPGNLLEKNTDGYYELSVSYNPNQNIKVIFNNNSGSQTADLVVGTISGNYEGYVYPSGVIGTEIKPVINGNEVTFSYTNDEAGSVELRGTMNNWADTENGGYTITMTKNGSTFSHTMTLPAGSYAYKFCYNNGSEQWMTDPMNPRWVSGGNSILIVPGIKDTTIEVQKGKAIALPTVLSYFNADETVTDVSGITYEVPEEYENYVTIEDGKIVIDNAYTGETLTLTAKATVDDVETSSTITVIVREVLYTYTIYAHSAVDERNRLDGAAVYVWDEAGETTLVTADHAFTTTEVLEDGRTWLKTELSLSCSEKIGLIFKSKSDWSWQTSDLFYENTAGEDVTLYWVDGYEELYTSLEDVPTEDRYIYVEYTNPDEAYEDMYVYAWNNGYYFNRKNEDDNGEITYTKVYFEYPVTELNGKYIAKIPVVMGETDKTIGFIMKKGAGWDTSVKEGGDNYVEIPASEDIVKVRFQDGEITEIVPYNKGSEINRKNEKLYFYFRDEALFADNNLSSLGDTVKVVVATSDGTTTSAETAYTMTYDSEDDRYECELELAEDTDYYYYYKIGETEVLDAYNKKTGVLNEKTYSLRRNKAYNVNVTAALAYESMTYEDNNVVTVTWAPKTENDDLEGFKIESAYADLSELGLSSRTPIDVNISSEYVALSFGCLEGTETGTKNISVTLIDDCEMSYTASTTVQITERTKTANTEEKLGDFDWDEAVIYFAVTDRFYDGNTSNNTLVDDTDTTDGSRYHGGDWAGLTAKIDYLYDLGVNTIWLTPIVDNIDTGLATDVANQESYGYHGYWTSDFTELNPHLGTEEEFKALIDAAHAKGMKVMVDIVINHAGYGTESTFNNIIETDATDASGNPIYKPMLRDESNTVEDDQRMDSLSGLPDFVTEDPEVRAQLIEWQTTWMREYAIDYYRIDTVKHVDDTTWAAFKNELTKINQDFKIIGEYYDAGFYNDYDQLDTGKMDSLLDFNFNDIMTNLAGENLSAIEEALEDRNTMLTNTATLGSFLSSHDEPGFLYTLTNDYDEGDWANSLMKVAATFQITAKGQPVIYYGEEIGLTGANNYPYQDNRYDFNWTSQAAQEGTAGSMYEHYKTMLNIRRDYSEVFAKGDRSQVVEPLIYDADGNKVEKGYEVFSRSYEGKTIYVGVNVWGDAKDATFFVDGTAGESYTDLYSGATYTVSSNGTITVSIPGASNGGTAVVVRTDGAASEMEDTNEVTIKLHYDRSDNTYTDWNAWIWADGLGGKQYDFTEENGEMVATITVDGRKTSNLWYRIRKGDWKENDHNGKDQKIDFSDIVSGTVHYYIESGVWGTTRVLGTDAVTGNKVLSAAYDRNSNTVLVETSMPVTGTIENAFAIECTSNSTPIDILRVEENISKYTIKLDDDLTSMEALLKSYGMTFEGYPYTLNMPNIYSTAEFENKYTYDGTDLGATYTESATTFKVWAPTADSVSVNIYESGTKGTEDKLGTYTMTKAEKGVWEYTLNGDWDGKYYTYTVNVNNEVNEVCDPYARTTGVNGDRAMILDMDSTDPVGWENDTGAHEGMNYTDAVIYELHVRDLSIDDSSGVSEKHQGKFLGLTETGTTTENGVPTALDHMIELGVTHLHLLPIYDYASVDESRLDETKYDPQFNWGYDPLNYNVPEGSYSTDPYNGEVRVKELKQAIQALHNNNINVVMDVVYNHVYDAESFAFNQLVPKYFSRTNPDGSYSNGSGCGNDTATERSMVHKYVVESVLYWHEEYHIDGFRFDLVGLLDTETINKIVEEVHARDKDHDIIFYGEGWTLGTALSKDGYLMATQANAKETPEFAYFSDTVRNGIAGTDTNGQGFIWQNGNEEDVAKYFTATTWWCPSPIQTINYVSCHDNYTLMDKINVVSNAAYDSYDDIPGDYQVSLNNLAAAIYMFSEGIPLIHAGEEFLRTKLD